MKANNLIEYAILNGEVNKAALNEMIKQLPENIQQRFVEAILCIVCPENLVKDIPKVKSIYGHENCRFLSYNYLYDRVNYEFEEEETRWFNNEDSANRFSAHGDYCWEGKREQEEGYDFKASHVFKRTSDCALNSWMEAR